MRNLTTRKFVNNCLCKKLLYSVMDEATLFKPEMIRKRGK